MRAPKSGQTPAMIDYRRRVGWGDIDGAQVWKFVAALRYVEEAEIELLRREQILDELYPHLPRVRIEASCHHAVRFDELVRVRLRVLHVGTSSVEYAFTIFRCRQVVADGGMTAVHIDASGRARSLPESVRHALTRTAEPGSRSTTSTAKA
jgi:acyl-CoA thioester hydrolase